MTPARATCYDRAAMARQFIVQLDQPPGALASLAEALGGRVASTCAAIGEGGIGDPGQSAHHRDDDTARAVLTEGGYTFIEGESI